MEAEMATTQMAIGGGWDTASGSSTYPYPYPYVQNGYTCYACGMWVAYGTTHFCQARVTVNPIITYVQEAGVSDYELKQMAEIAEALDKARTCYGNLREDDSHKRAVTYLAARFGVSEDVIIDLLVEEA